MDMYCPPDGFRPFEETYILYKDGSITSQFLAICSLSPVFIVVSFVTMCIFHRYTYVYIFFAGQMGNVALNSILKHSMQQSRPNGTWRQDGGMPSNHSQFMAFFCTYALLLLYNRLSFGSVFSDVLGAIALILLTITVAYSRVSLGYHTANQVFVGMFAGGISAFLWFQIVQKWIRSLVVPHLTWLTLYCKIKDEVKLPGPRVDLFTIEYNSLMNQAKGD